VVAPADAFFPPVVTASEENVYYGGRLVAKRTGVQTQFSTGLVTDFTMDRLHSKGDGSKFYPYGESRTSAAGDDREQFATYTRDQGTGLDYADQRWFVSGLGRFGSSDPYFTIEMMQEPNGWNRYIYVASDPVTYYDPLGLYYCSAEYHNCGNGGGGYNEMVGIDAPNTTGGGGGGWQWPGITPDCLGLPQINGICVPMEHNSGIIASPVVPVAVGIPIIIEITPIIINATGVTISIALIREIIREWFLRVPRWTVRCNVHPIGTANHESLGYVTQRNVPAPTARDAIEVAKKSLEALMQAMYGAGNHLQHCHAH
jgi:RHS repeat-associated protein